MHFFNFLKLLVILHLKSIYSEIHGIYDQSTIDAVKSDFKISFTIVLILKMPLKFVSFLKYLMLDFKFFLRK